MSLADQSGGRGKDATPGLFITFEGGEGCGKSTQVARLAAWLGERGIEAVTLREPGGTAIGEHIRTLLQFTPEAHGMAPETELLLFAASRAQLVREVIVSRLRNGAFVVSDRFHDSTTVYQGAGRKLDAAPVAAINAFAIGATLPDVTFLIDLPVDVARARMMRRPRPAGVPDRMESLPEEFYETVRNGYLRLAESEPERFVVIDGTKSVELVFAKIVACLGQRFPDRFK
jgi:dTMP kinase